MLRQLPVHLALRVLSAFSSGKVAQSFSDHPGPSRRDHSVDSLATQQQPASQISKSLVWPLEALTARTAAPLAVWHD